jgi:predicted phosphodiesterase
MILKPIETWVVFTDVHLSHKKPCHPSYTVFKKFVQEIKPDGIVCLGDWIDFEEISKFSNGNLSIDRNNVITKDYVMINKELDFFQKYTKKFIFLEGNHEERCVRYSNKFPEAEQLINLPDNLRLEKRGIKYFTQVEQPVIIGNLAFIHGWFYSEHFAYRTLNQSMRNIVMGHAHRAQSYTTSFGKESPTMSAYSLGALTDVDPAYFQGKVTHHTNGFGVINFEKSGNFSFYPVVMNNNRFLWSGKLYKI